MEKELEDAVPREQLPTEPPTGVPKEGVDH
jgi:hypothetical protein